MGDCRLTDWIEILKEQTATGDQMGREVPQMLANPDISEAQVKTLFSRAGEAGRVRREAAHGAGKIRP